MFHLCCSQDNLSSAVPPTFDLKALFIYLFVYLFILLPISIQVDLRVAPHWQDQTDGALIAANMASKKKEIKQN